MFYGRKDAPERDRFLVREPEEEERAAFAAHEPAPGSEVRLASIHL
ncbi:hypothetical protein [Azospirillum canadense]|nr:hypothetical protein [Azospirillum canadense]MCW2242775.1 hypothetical protein [Azospirillum canadense]